MAENNFLDVNNQLVFEYIDRYSSICIVLLDEHLAIKHCNQAFLHILGLQAVPSGENLTEYLLAEDKLLKVNPLESGFHKVHFTLLNKVQNHCNMIGYFATIKEGYLLFCEKAWVTEDAIFLEVSKINNQLANRTRELNKKNIALEKANATINKLLRFDFLTKIANRRHFLECFRKMYAHAVRHNNPLSLVMIDLDFFKKINDHYGHQAGDEVLIEFAQLLQDDCREEDLPARYGGEEFVILLVQTDLKQACSQAERIRQTLEKMELGAVRVKITSSFGVATLRKGDTMDSMLKRADDALYEAKHGGRNRVNVEYSGSG